MGSSETTGNAGVDFINDPDLRIRDLSYTGSRVRQLVDLAKGSFFDMGFGPRNGDSDSYDVTVDEEWPRDRLEIYIKDKPRGPGYVCDIVYYCEDLPVTVYAVLINRGRGLEVAELELFRRNWGCFDDHDNYLHPDDQDPIDPDEPTTLITSDTLRRIPLGDILARVERDLPDDSWRNEGIQQVPGNTRLRVEDLSGDQRRALENTTTVTARRKGRPELSDELLIEVAEAYIGEAARGRGAIGRLSTMFDRPEPTIRDWISTARKREFLAPTTPGRRGAAPGPKLPRPPRAYAAPDLTRVRRRTVLRMIERDRILDADIGEDALLLYTVSGLVCNEVGVAKMDALQAAMQDPQVLDAALNILNKARRRHAAAAAGSGNIASQPR
ncbi:hypothetical protein ACWDUN_22500 [Mycobacterium sp. NPDC003323]